MDDVGKLAVAGVNFVENKQEPVDIMRRDLGFKHGELAFFFGSAHAGPNDPSLRSDNVYNLHAARNDVRFDTSNPQEDKAEGHIPYLHLVNGDVQPDQLTQAEHHDLPLDHAEHAEDNLTGTVLNYNHRNDVKPGYATEEERDEAALLMGQNRRFNVEPENGRKRAEQRYHDMMQINRQNIAFAERMRELDRQIQEMQRRIDGLQKLGDQIDRDTQNGKVTINANTAEGRLQLEEYQRHLDEVNSKLKIENFIDANGNFEYQRFQEARKREQEEAQRIRDRLDQDKAELQGSQAKNNANTSTPTEADSSARIVQENNERIALLRSHQEALISSREVLVSNQEVSSSEPLVISSSNGVMNIPGMSFAGAPSATVASNFSVSAQPSEGEVRVVASANPPPPPAAALSETFAGGERALGSYATSTEGVEVNVIASSFNTKANETAIQTPTQAPGADIQLAATTQQNTTTSALATRRI